MMMMMMGNYVVRDGQSFLLHYQHIDESPLHFHSFCMHVQQLSMACHILHCIVVAFYPLSTVLKTMPLEHLYCINMHELPAGGIEAEMIYLFTGGIFYVMKNLYHKGWIDSWDNKTWFCTSPVRTRRITNGYYRKQSFASFYVKYIMLPGFKQNVHRLFV